MPVKPKAGEHDECNSRYSIQIHSLTNPVYLGGDFKGANSTNAIVWVGTSGWANIPLAGFNEPVNAISKATSRVGIQIFDLGTSNLKYTGSHKPPRVVLVPCLIQRLKSLGMIKQLHKNGLERDALVQVVETSSKTIGDPKIMRYPFIFIYPVAP